MNDNQYTIQQLQRENQLLKQELDLLRKEKFPQNDNIIRQNDSLKFFDLPLHILLVASPDGIIKRINPGWQESLGYLPEEVLNTNFLDLIHPDDVDPTLKQMKKLLEGETVFYFENRYRAKSGGYRWFVWSAQYDAGNNVYYAIAHDITDRKQNEKELKRREAALNTIIQKPVEYVIYQLKRETPDSELKLINFSPSVQDILGLEDWQLNSFSEWMNLVHPEDKEILKRADEIAGHPPFELDIKIRFVHKTKGTRWCHTRTQGIPFDSHPDILEYANGVIVDITKDKLYEEVLAESEKKLRKFSQNAPGIFYQYKLTRKGEKSFQFLSDNIEKIFGYPASRFLTNPELFFETIHPDDKKLLVEETARSAKHLTRYNLDYRIITATGETRWLSTSSDPEKFSDGTILWTGIGFDITEKKKAEVSLKESEQTLMSIFNHAPVVMLLLNEKTEIVALNETAKKYAGKPGDEIVGTRGGNLLDCIGTLNNPAGCGGGIICKTCDIRNTITKTLVHGEPQQKVEAELTKYDGEGKVVILTLLVSSDIVYKNEKRHILVTIDDMTERKKTETKLKLYQEHLEELVDEKTIKLKRTNQLLQEEIKKQKEAEEAVKKALEVEKELNNMKTEFVSMVSHEFRTPLTSIMASADLLEINNPELDEFHLGKHVSKIQRSVDTMTHMLNDVLAISRAEKGRLGFNPEPADLLSLLNDIIEEESQRLKAANKFNIRNQLQEQTFKFDQNLFRQFFSNVISNAIKFSPPSEVIEVNLFRENSHLNIEVIDRGCGIKPDEVSQIMEPFMRGTGSENIQGNGLGMTIIQNAVKTHGGEFFIKSVPKAGTRCCIKLPIERS